MPSCSNKSYFGTEETKKDETKKTKTEINSIVYYILVIVAVVTLLSCIILGVLSMTGNMGLVSKKLSTSDIEMVKLGSGVGFVVSLIVLLVVLLKTQPKKSDDSSKDETKTTTTA